MRKPGGPWFAIVVMLIAAMTYLAVFGWHLADGTTVIRGVDDICWGIDISGGISVTLAPDSGVDDTVARENMDEAVDIISRRLEEHNVSSHQIYTDKENMRIIVGVPWQPQGAEATEKVIANICATARIEIVEGRLGSKSIALSYGDVYGRMIAVDSNGIKHRMALDSAEIASARKVRGSNGDVAVLLTFTDVGRQLFLESTGRLTAYGENSDQRWLTICMDGRPLSEMYIGGALTEAIISRDGGLSDEEVQSVVNYVNNGALPFEMQIIDYELIDATLGADAINVMIIAGVIAFGLICAFMIIRYRLPGVVASIALLGQVAGILAAVSGFFPIFDGFTLTLPGVAGIILSIGMGVDANIITGERISEEVRKGKTIEGAIDAGNENSLPSIFDGNVTVIIVAVILMGMFGPRDSVFGFLFQPITYLFAASAVDAIYAFGYTLFAGVICNFIMGVTASRIMLRSLSGFRSLHSRWMYGGGEH